MPKNVTYHTPAHQEENTPLVAITGTDIAKQQSTGIDSRKATYVIDLAKSAFGGTHYPAPGSMWYLKKISTVWVLMARSTRQNPQLSPSLTPHAGDTFIGSEGTTTITGTGIIVSGGNGSTAQSFNAIGASAAAAGHTGAVTGDTSKRVIIHDDGKTEWGPGNAPVDTNLYRNAAGILATDGSVLLTDSTKQVNVGGSGSSAKFAGKLAVNTDFVISSRVTTDTQSRLTINGDGKAVWGTGALAGDASLYRNGVGELKTDTNFNVAGNMTGAAQPPTFNVYTATGTSTWTKPANAKMVHIRVIAGGGGSGGRAATGAAQVVAAGGGGGGGYAELWILASSVGSTETVTVGLGGTPGASGGLSAAGTGGTSSFGTWASANGGTGGQGSNVAQATSVISVTCNGGSGGTGAATGGFVSIGGDGGYGMIISGLHLPGVGGSSGGLSGEAQGSGVGSTGGGGAPGKTYGGGAGGTNAAASQGAVQGGTGAQGIVIVEVYY